MPFRPAGRADIAGKMKGQAQPFEYRLKTERLRFGTQELEIECLENLDATIDALFAHLERGGDQSLLEDLCPYFGVVWPSARALCDHLLENGMVKRLPGASVLEVGCGLAIPAMLAARLGAKVTATDFHPEVEAFLRRNIERNQIKGLRYLKFDWTRSNETGEQYDIVLGSDILYERSHPANVARAVASMVRPGGTAIVADPARPYLQEFSDEMQKLGFRSKTDIRRAAGKDVFLLLFHFQT